MQTPGLPASSPSSPHHNANSFFSDQPSHAAEQFGDVMNRTLHSGMGTLPVRTGTPGENALSVSRDLTDHHGDEKRSSVKSKKPLHRASENRTNREDGSSANPHFIGLGTPTIPHPAQSPNDSSGNSHEPSDADDSITPLSADAPNTVVTNANPNETDTDNSAAKPTSETLGAQSAETTASVEHAQSSPSADLAKALAASPIEATADPAESSPARNSTLSETEIADSKDAVAPLSASPPHAHGIPAAKQDMTMKKADKMQKVAGSVEQDLPGYSATGSEELPKGQKISEKGASQGEKAESAVIELPTRVSTSVNPPSATITTDGVAPSSTIETRVLERTHDIVALHAMRLTDTGAQSLHVVVKPGNGIQISLELRQSARGIEVSASLHKGDYDQLNQHWPDLQERLEARGVRVSTLTPSENYTGTGQHFHQSKQQSSQQESLHAGAFAEFALAGSMTEAPAARAARASAYRGWETWA
jgi:hypothetical protein